MLDGQIRLPVKTTGEQKIPIDPKTFRPDTLLMFVNKTEDLSSLSSFQGRLGRNQVVRVYKIFLKCRLEVTTSVCRDVIRGCDRLCCQTRVFIRFGRGTPKYMFY